MTRRFSFILIIALFLSEANAQVDPINLEGIAIGGYDVVAYFKPGVPVRGDKQFTHEVKNVTYYFSSKENLEEFKQNRWFTCRNMMAIAPCPSAMVRKSP